MNFNFNLFKELMAHRVEDILIISSPYEAFVMQEDGGMLEHVFASYRGISLTRPPTFTKVSTAQEALKVIQIKKFDLVVIHYPKYLGMNAVTLGNQLKEVDKNVPVVLLAHGFRSISQEYVQKLPPDSIDKIFVWSGNRHIMWTIIKWVEDQLNIDHDIEIAKVRVLILIEDSPYSELRYSGEKVPSMKSMDVDGRVIYLGTFSKILAPGFRVAWCIAEHDLLNKLTIVKQAADLCTNTLGQHIAAEYVTKGYLDEHVEKIKAIYVAKRDKMLAAMDKHFPKEAKWTKPDGGMFIWVTLPEYIDTKEMFPRAIENNVAYVNGAAFFADHSGKNTMRLNFTYATDEQIDIGIKRLADTIKQEILDFKDEKPSKKFMPDEEGLVLGV